MDDVFRFRNFPVYNDARQFCKKLKDLSRKKFPKEEQYCLMLQMWRALDSIILNIAEGSDRFSDIDFSRFLNNSLSSVNEVVACLDFALDDEYITEIEHKEFLIEAKNLVKQLRAFASKVRKDGKKN